MSSPTLIKAINFEPSQLTFSDCKIDDNGRKLVYVNYNGGKLRMQTPRMKLPFGCKKWGKNDSEFSFELEMSFSGSETNNDLQIFQTKLEEFDNIMLEKIMENGSSWLGRPKLNKDVIEAAGLYNPSLRVSKDKNTGENLPYPSRFKAKLDRNRDTSGSKQFLSDKKYKNPVLFEDGEKNPLKITEDNAEQLISKGSEMISIVELVYLSITKTVSAKFKLVQGRVYENKNCITSMIMMDDDEDENISHGIENITLEKDLDNVYNESVEEITIVKNNTTNNLYLEKSIL
jgi:hypothetical protein